ncbi:MAG: type IV pilus modification protein PilV [Burkholderiales bacterium]|nr:type IV pilus modification protein PilV [Burkholderiales bacterium]
MSTPHAQRQRGITLIESLVAILVAALGVLGILGVQMRTLADTSTTVRRAQAIRLIEDLGERLKVHPNALMVLGSYQSGWTANLPTPPAATNCASVTCTPTQFAAYDVAEWKRLVQRSLPLGDANIFIPAGETAITNNRRQLGVMISWRENEQAGLSAIDRQNTDATRVRTSSGTLVSGAGSAATCPADSSCQLQFIPVAARCAPDLREGAANPKYFCAGP